MKRIEITAYRTTQQIVKGWRDGKVDTSTVTICRNEEISLVSEHVRKPNLVKLHDVPSPGNIVSFGSAIYLLICWALNRASLQTWVQAEFRLICPPRKLILSTIFISLWKCEISQKKLKVFHTTNCCAFMYSNVFLLSNKSHSLPIISPSSTRPLDYGRQIANSVLSRTAWWRSCLLVPVETFLLWTKICRFQFSQGLHYN